MPKLQLYNSLTRKKENFVPLDERHIRLYACGPTVYNYAHIGNARMAVVFDLLARVLREAYPESRVTYVSNITDVDDKIIVASQETGEKIEDITEKYGRIYNEDMAALGVQVPDVQPKATEHIGEMIALIEALIGKEHAYESDGHVLFHVPSFPAYGGLSGGAAGTSRLPGRGWKWRAIRKTRRILCCGSRQVMMNRDGTAHGVVAVRDGILNVRRWRKSIWGCRLTFMAAGRI